MSERDMEEVSDEDVSFEGEFTMDASATQDENVRRDIRRQYRDLNQETQLMMDKLDETRPEELKILIERADTLFGKVTMTREAALDSQQMHLCAQILKRNAEALSANLAEFKPFEFAEKLVRVLGNRIENDRTDGGSEDLIMEENWIDFGKQVLPMFKKAPSFHFMYGSFEAQQVQTERKRRPRAKDDEVAKAVIPKQVAEIKKSEQETTTEEVERVLGILKALYKTDREPLCYFSFVIDPNSFARTVENVFHVSFLIKDGLAGICQDEHRLPVIWPTDETEDTDKRNEANQFVMTLTVDDWEELVAAFQITKPCIKPRIRTL